MKKNIFKILVMLLAFSCIFIGCDNPEAPIKQEEQNQEPKGPAQASWFEYTTEGRITTEYGWTTKQTTIFYINTDGAIERAGSESYEYFGTQLEMLQNQLSWSICRKNATYDVHVSFKVTEPPVWADNNTSDDDFDNNTEDENDINDKDDNKNNDENSSDKEDSKEEPETTLPAGYEWWCFEGAILNYDYFYVLYKNNEAIRCGVENRELDVRDYGLYSNKEQAIYIHSFSRNYYQINNLSELPTWAR